MGENTKTFILPRIGYSEDTPKLILPNIAAYYYREGGHDKKNESKHMLAGAAPFVARSRRRAAGGARGS